MVGKNNVNSEKNEDGFQKIGNLLVVVVLILIALMLVYFMVMIMSGKIGSDQSNNNQVANITTNQQLSISGKVATIGGGKLVLTSIDSSTEGQNLSLIYGENTRFEKMDAYGQSMIAVAATKIKEGDTVTATYVGSDLLYLTVQPPVNVGGMVEKINNNDFMISNGGKSVKIVVDQKTKIYKQKENGTLEGELKLVDISVGDFISCNSDYDQTMNADSLVAAKIQIMPAPQIPANDNSSNY